MWTTRRQLFRRSIHYFNAESSKCCKCFFVGLFAGLKIGLSDVVLSRKGLHEPNHKNLSFLMIYGDLN